MIRSMYVKFSYLLVPALMLASCGGKKEVKPSEGLNIENKISQSGIDQNQAITSHPGKPLYEKHCLPCHQADGNGVPSMYPSIVDTKWINGDNETLISIVLHGMDEEITVKGEVFNAIMAPLPHLNDQEVSDILNFVRQKFGSSKEIISPDEVKKVRSSGK